MKQQLLTYIFVLTTVFICSAQQTKTNCKCSENKMTGTKNGQQPDTSFHFSNSKIIILCGYKNPDIKPTTFSEFTLSICGQDTTIDFWDATLTCKLSFKKDTLIIEDIRNLPIGENRTFTTTVWSIEKIYFSKKKFKRKYNINKTIRKYTNEEIQTTLKEYESNKSPEEPEELAYRLFISSISGNLTAKKYFDTFGEKYTLDGALAEEYGILTAMLGLWNNEK